MGSSTDSGQVGRTGARFGGGRQRPAPAQLRFEHVLRGYDRAEVDAFVARQETVLDGVRADLAEAQRSRDAASERAETAEQENAVLRRAAAEPAPMAETGFGSRAEKILRMAEREASEARARAAAESAALIDAARSSVEAHRHQVEEELIGRVSRAEQTAALLEADREEARRVHDAAVRTAGVLKGAAEAEADEIRLKARAEVEGMRESARHDLARLSGVRSDVRSDLDRLVRLLETEARTAAAVAAADQSRPAENVASVSALE